jgi:hypothetical protein
MKHCLGFTTRVVKSHAIVAVAYLFGGCSLVLDAEGQQCNTTADCTARGPAFQGGICQSKVCVADPAWACLEDSTTSDKPSNSTVAVQVPLVSVLNQAPIQGVSAQLYRKIDVASANPLGSEVVSGSDGMLSLNVEQGFDGFIKLTHPDLGTSLYFFNPPVTRPETTPPVRLASPTMVGALLQQVGKSYDSSLGIVVLTAQDCTGRSAAGVSYKSLTVGPTPQVFYSVEGLPTVNVSATDKSGYGGLIGLAPGTVAISGSTENFGPIGKLSLFVKAGVVSYSRMVPHAGI